MSKIKNPFSCEVSEIFKKNLDNINILTYVDKAYQISNFINENKNNNSERHLSIGGSDSGAVLGFSKYRTPYDVWLQKTQYESSYENEITSYDSNISIELGSYLEPWIASNYEKITGTKITRNVFIRHPDISYLTGNIDAVTENGVIVEFKTARKTDEWGEEGTDIIPKQYYFQCCHYMACYNSNLCHLFVFFKDTETFRLYKIERDFTIENDLIDKLCYFWNENVLKKIPPVPVSVNECNKRWPASSLKTLNCDDSNLSDIIQKIKHAKESVSRIEESIEKYKIFIMNYMRETEILNDSSGNKLCSWKSQKRDIFNTERFKKDFPDLYKKYIKEINYRVFKNY